MFVSVTFIQIRTYGIGNTLQLGDVSDKNVYGYIKNKLIRDKKCSI